MTGSSQTDVDRLTDRHTDKLTTVPRACVLRQIDKKSIIEHSFVNSRNLIGQSEGTKSLGARLYRALS